ncbi:MAG TPA: ATP-binding cassette domain-containing protein, partial [Herpetosiphonaceae bacterium]|nr:ATP-binding cassette domain-containing protein [Herpetosiphonaceae bacterium]
MSPMERRPRLSRPLHKRRPLNPRPDQGKRPMALLELQDVHTYYGNIHALKGISFGVNEGEIATLIGSNGAGKSTTLRTIS